MRKLLLVLLICVVASVSLSAQDETSNSVFDLYVQVQVDGETPFIPDTYFESLHRFFEETSDISVGFFTLQADLYERLTIFDFTPDEDLSDLFLAESPTLLVQLTPYAEIDTVTVTPYSGLRFPPLPLGTYAWSLIFGVNEVSSSRVQSTVVGTAAIGFYVANRCDLALPLLDGILLGGPIVNDGILVREGANFYFGNCAYALGEYDFAIQAYNAIISENDTPADRQFSESAAINLAWMYVQQDDTDSALQLLDDHVGIRYNDINRRILAIWLARARLYADLGDADAALAEYERLLAIAESPESPFNSFEHARIFAERGNLYLRLGQFNTAFADLEQAIATEQDYPKTYFIRAQLYETLGNMDEAYEDYTTFLGLMETVTLYHEEDLTGYVQKAQEILDGA